jgi:sec-independent protein translocase protein TatB
MFDISWTEFLLIGVVALIVIGPKELPTVLRTLGQWTRRVRSMAADFQNQFQEAMREAEMTDLKKQVDDIAHDIKSYDPLKDVRADVEAAGKDIQSSLEKATSTAPATAEGEPAPSEAPVAQDAIPSAAEPVAHEVAEQPAAAAEQPAAANGAPEPAPSNYAREAAIVAAAIAPVVPETVENRPGSDAKSDARPDTAGHGG